MSKQFTFYLAPSDQIPFEKNILESGDVCFLRAQSSNSTPEVLESSVISKYGEETLGILIARKSDIKNISFLPIPHTDKFSVDINTAPVIEFSRSYVSESFIRNGRLYAVTSYFDDQGNKIDKSTDFISWVDTLFSKLKSSLVLLDDGAYAGSQALEMKNEGCILKSL